MTTTAAHEDDDCRSRRRRLPRPPPPPDKTDDRETMTTTTTTTTTTTAMSDKSTRLRRRRWRRDGTQDGTPPVGGVAPEIHRFFIQWKNQSSFVVHAPSYASFSCCWKYSSASCSLRSTASVLRRYSRSSRDCSSGMPHDSIIVKSVMKTCACFRRQRYALPHSSMNLKHARPATYTTHTGFLVASGDALIT